MWKYTHIGYYENKFEATVDINNKLNRSCNNG